MPGDWAGPSVEFNLGNTSAGLASLRLSADGWTEVESRSFSTAELPLVGQRMTIDVFVPSPRPNPYWGGQVAAYLNCPSVGVWWQWLGDEELLNLFPGEWNSIGFPLSPAMIAALTSGADDCSIRLTVSTPQTQFPATFLVDRVGFLD